MELTLFHDTAQAEVGNHDIRVLSWCPEEQVLGF